MGSRGHTFLTVLVALLIPVASRIEGTGNLAFTMFSRSETYRLRIETIDADGRARRLAPTAIAASVGGNTGDILAGTEHWLHAPFGPLLRSRLGEIARLACHARGDTVRARGVSAQVSAHVSAHVSLEQRPTLDSPIQVTEASSACP